MSEEKVPATPPDQLYINHAEHIRDYSGPLWRVFRTEGPRALEWHELRHYGPVPGMRFDPHPEPAGMHPDVGVMYASTLPYTALGEVYQSTRVIARAQGGVAIVAWIPSRPLRLLDLTSNWPVLNGAAAAMMMDSKATTQAWARAIYDTFGTHLDGLYHQSSINNEPLVTLFSRTERLPAFPPRPRFSILLRDPTADELVAQAVQRLGYRSL